MKLTNLHVLALTVAAFGAGSLVTSRLMTPAPVAADANHVFELRVYHSTPGRLGDIVKRFKDDTRKVFEKHDMTSVGYWVPQDAPGKDNLLIYILSHPSREAATKNWAAFRDDPEWKAITARTEANGKIVDHVDSTFMDPTDFSKIK